MHAYVKFWLHSLIIICEYKNVYIVVVVDGIKTND